MRGARQPTPDCAVGVLCSVRGRLRCRRRQAARSGACHVSYVGRIRHTQSAAANIRMSTSLSCLYLAVRSAVGGGRPQSVARDARRYSSSCRAAVVTPLRRHTSLAALGAAHIMLQAPSPPRRSNSVLTYLQASGLDVCVSSCGCFHALLVHDELSAGGSLGYDNDP